MKQLGLLFFLGLLALNTSFLPNSAYASEAYEKAAVKAAQEWLVLVDQGNYLESWNQAAELLKSQVTKDEWARKIGGVLPPLGKAKNRQLLKVEYAKSLPGAPDGDYVVIQFQTSFEQKKNAVETITPKRDKEGKWRVAGYLIR